MISRTVRSRPKKACRRPDRGHEADHAQPAPVFHQAEQQAPAWALASGITRWMKDRICSQADVEADQDAEWRS